MQRCMFITVIKSRLRVWLPQFAVTHSLGAGLAALRKNCSLLCCFSNLNDSLWTVLFVYSKIFELADTVLLVLQKKKVIFLHVSFSILPLISYSFSGFTTSLPSFFVGLLCTIVSGQVCTAFVWQHKFRTWIDCLLWLAPLQRIFLLRWTSSFTALCTAITSLGWSGFVPWSSHSPGSLPAFKFANIRHEWSYCFAV